MDYRDADGQEGSFQRFHRVYQRAGQPCRRCRALIRRILAAGRSTFFCPRCQRRPRNSADRFASVPFRVTSAPTRGSRSQPGRATLRR
jgi:tRNA(Ile2) C34 agmatinyltransferase TiaS